MLRNVSVLLLALSLAAGIVMAVYQSANAAPSRLEPTNQTRQAQDKPNKPPVEQKKKKKKKDDKKEPILARFMRQKLGASNRVLKGLVTDDFEEIEKGADALMKMSLAEEWRVSNDPSYARFSLDYQNTVRKLKAKAKKGTIDGSALAWVDVTMSCIECHEWIRNTVIVENDFPLLPE